MRRFGIFGLSLAIACSFGAGVSAQSLSASSGPREIPPASFTGRQYVDSAGCVFIRAGVSGITNWVPRVTRGRKMICGQTPTFARNTTAPMAAAPIAPKPAVVAPRVIAQPTRRVVASAPAVVAPTIRRAAPVQQVVVPAARTAVNLGGQCPNVSAASQAYINSTGVRCGSQVWKPGAGQRIAGGQVHGASVGSPAATYNVPTIQTHGIDRHLYSRVITSQSHGRQAQPQSSTQGYRSAWTDGRLNPLRGIPGQQAYRQAAPQAAQDNSWYPPRPTQKATVSTRTMAPVAASAGDRWVQVGTFGNAANAQRTAGRFQSMGMPVRVGRSGAYQVVMIGPFNDTSSLNSALSKARSAGFGDAYARR